MRSRSPRRRRGPDVGLVLALVLSVLGACSSSPSLPAVSRGAVADPRDIAETVDDAVFTVDCAFSHRAADDPIVKPGRTGASHSHDFFGNVTTDASSTAATLAGKATTCEDKDDTASYWAPSLLRAGAEIEPMVLRAYYRASVGSDVTATRAPPAGIELLSGDAKAARDQPTSTVGWGCGFRPRQLSARPPSTCTVSSPLTLQLSFPDCWDGWHLQSADHRSHAAFSVDGTCPEDHPVPITQLQLSIQYPIWGDARAVTLASGPTRTAHGDFLNSWDQARLEDEVDLCIHAHANCTIG